MTAVIPKGGLVVSCQARADNPLHGPAFMAAMARAAEQGGAVAIRANGGADIAAIRRVTALPIIGLVKRMRDGEVVYITPDEPTAREAAAAGADVIAMDATLRVRTGPSPDALIRFIKEELGRPVMADIATEEDAEMAVKAGADCVATTLSGYTDGSPAGPGPDIALVRRLAARLPVPVLAEGRYGTPDEVRSAFAAGAHAVVVGTAITNPREITRTFALACPREAGP